MFYLYFNKYIFINIYKLKITIYYSYYGIKN